MTSGSNLNRRKLDKNSKGKGHSSNSDSIIRGARHPGSATSTDESRVEGVYPQIDSEKRS